ncbi:MAG: glycoside hydrolase family 5 protein, partial [Myxococcales bacterium]|nr:glycoside hydrolase family 5 protein [Myxococcales bacterium]
GGDGGDGGAPPGDGAGAVDGGGGGEPVYRGVNLSSAEWGEGNLPGTYGTDYTYPTTDEVDYFAATGMNVVRVAFRWERLQQSLDGAFDAAELARLDALVGHATGRGVHVVLDPHNYARYRGDVIGSAAVPRAAYADLWRRLAEHYGGDPRVIFGLMNEPNTMPTEDWLAAANAAIAAIRDAGAGNLILVPGNAWTGAHSWLQDWYGTPNGTVMTGVVDPADRYAIEVHQYLDGDFSGTSATYQSATVGVEQLAPFTAWARDHGVRAFLGELGGAANDTCLQAIDAMLDHVDGNPDVWIGWTWWAAGPWWGDYIYSLEPVGGVDRPQLAVLREHLP